MAAGGSGLEITGEQIEKAFGAAWKAHKTPDKHYTRINSSEVIISFPASGSVKDWYSGRNFGETKIDLTLFPSLKSIGNSEAAKVNEAFLKRFQDILNKSAFIDEVDKAMSKQKQVVFAGHSSGAPIAILATLWTLEKYLTPKSDRKIPLCVTFCSPLVGNHIFSHATRRENWSRCFFHFVMRYDIAPRILLAPLSSLDQSLEQVSQFFNPKSKSFMSESIGRATETSDFYSAVMSSAASVTSHAACKLMGTTDATLETLANFVPLSPYRPFGTYIFCTVNGNEGKQIVVRNPGAVLQLLFFSAQINTEVEADQVPFRSLYEHVINDTELQQTLRTQNVVYLDQLGKLPLSEDSSSGDTAKINEALNYLGLSTRARLCLRAAGESEARKRDTEEAIKKKKAFVEERMKKLKDYKDMWSHQKLGYYDGFKIQGDTEDFKANVKRLELAGVWDEIIEKLRSYELPDEFEGNKEWVEQGTKFRRLVEPLDIANYYRHSRDQESGTYMEKGRPKRYRYTQKWLEHAERRPEETISESCFWAEVEDLRNMTNNNLWSSKVKERVVTLENLIKTWSTKGEVREDVFLEGSTLVKWWKLLPLEHKQKSSIRNLLEA